MRTPSGPPSAIITASSARSCFSGAEPLEDDEKCHRDLIEDLDASDPVLVERDRLGEPVGPALLAARPGGVELIEAKARDHLPEISLGRADFDRALLPADPCLLHRVLGATHFAEHAIGERAPEGTRIAVCVTSLREFPRSRRPSMRKPSEERRTSAIRAE